MDGWDRGGEGGGEGQRGEEGRGLAGGLLVQAVQTDFNDLHVVVGGIGSNKYYKV